MSDYRSDVTNGFIEEDGEPIKCKSCNGILFRDICVDKIDYIETERERVCSECDYLMGYWSYGSWEWEY